LFVISWIPWDCWCYSDPFDQSD
jgi:hypothetical protein